MLLAYMDESSTPDRYWLGALICPEGVVQPLSDELDEIARKAVQEHKVPYEVEFHGYPLFHLRGDWAKLTPNEAIAIYTSVFEAIASHEVEVVIRGVVTKALQARKPHSILLEQLLERIERRARAHEQLALVIADHVPDEDSELYRHHFRYFQRMSTAGYKPVKVEHLVDTLYFASSHASRLVQAVDMVLFLWQRLDTNDHPNDLVRDAVTDIWSRIEPRVQESSCWYPQPMR